MSEDSIDACVTALERALESGAPDLSGVPPATLERALRTLGARHGAAAVPLLRRIAAAGDKVPRKAARLALYRLEQAGVALPVEAPSRPIVTREAERVVRAWVSGIDGSGARGAWALVEGGLGGGLALCSLILNDQAGILEVTGGPTSRRRLDAQLKALAAEPGLPWIETAPAHVLALVGEALAAHAAAGTRPPADFEPWRRLLAPPTGAAGGDAGDTAPAPGPTPAADLEPGAPTRPAEPPIDPVLVERSAEILEVAELAGWFLDPGAVQDEALQLLEARESRLVLADHQKAAREAAIVDQVIDRLLDDDARRRWARRLTEMADVLVRARRQAPVELMHATARALADLERSARAIPFARALALRGLELAADVATGRARPAEVSRAPRRERPA